MYIYLIDLDKIIGKYKKMFLKIIFLFISIKMNIES